MFEDFGGIKKRLKSIDPGLNSFAFSVKDTYAKYYIVGEYEDGVTLVSNTIDLAKNSAEELEENPFALEENLDAGLEKYADKSAKGAVFLEIGMTAETVYVDKTPGRDMEYYYYVKGFKADTKRGETGTNEPPTTSVYAQDKNDDIQPGLDWYNAKIKDKEITIPMGITATAIGIGQGLKNNVFEVKSYMPKVKAITGEDGNFGLIQTKIVDYNLTILGILLSSEEKDRRIKTSNRKYYYAHSSIQDISGIAFNKPKIDLPYLFGGRLKYGVKLNQSAGNYIADDAVKFIKQEMSFKPSTEEDNYKWYKIGKEDMNENGGNDYKIDRNRDSEYKIFNHLKNDLKKASSESYRGNVFLYTDRLPCDSCKNVIYQFRKDYPNIHVQVYYSEKYKK